VFIVEQRYIKYRTFTFTFSVLQQQKAWRDWTGAAALSTEQSGDHNAPAVT